MIKSMSFLNKYNALILLVAGTAIACAGASTAQEPGGEAIAREPGANAVEANATAAAPTQSTGVNCEMTFTIEGWSAGISKAEGEGVVTCDNGQSEPVMLEITGGGLTFGETSIDEGKGVFSHVADIDDVFGSYAQAEASAGAMDDAVSAQALTKGEVSLAITTQGQGWSLGVSGAKFSITRPVVAEGIGDGS